MERFGRKENGHEGVEKLEIARFNKYLTETQNRV